MAIRLSRHPLTRRFMLVGSAVMTMAALILGSWVTFQIERGVVNNSATSAAIFMESFISPVSHEFADADGLSDPSRTALREIFLQSALGDRIVSYKIWGAGGEILDASNEELVGEEFELSEDQRTAWAGSIAASFEDLNDAEDAEEAELGIPLLEVYSPIYDPWSGEVIAVAEFYENATALAGDIRDARRNTWLIVLAVFLASSALLVGIVEAGGRQIERQRVELRERLVEAETLSRRNEDLSQRVRLAAQRSTAQADRVMQRIGQELHDGVAQHLSLAGLRLADQDTADEADAQTVRSSLDAAMRELRAISRGLALPDIENLTVSATVERAALDHEKAFGGNVALHVDEGLDVASATIVKLCCYRFLQEALYNAHKHAEAETIEVQATSDGVTISISVSDDGKGFQPEDHREVRQDGGQGLMGLRDRVETLGGTMTLQSAPQKGTIVHLSLSLREVVS